MGFDGDRPAAGDTPESVHLTDYPLARDAWRDGDLIAEMAWLRRLVEMGLAARKDAAIPVRQPLAAATIVSDRDVSPAMTEIFADERQTLSMCSNLAQMCGPKRLREKAALVLKCAFPGSMRSGENARQKSAPTASPDASSAGCTTSSVVPG